MPSELPPRRSLVSLGWTRTITTFLFDVFDEVIDVDYLLLHVFIEFVVLFLFDLLEIQACASMWLLPLNIINFLSRSFTNFLSRSFTN